MQKHLDSVEMATHQLEDVLLTRFLIKAMEEF